MLAITTRATATTTGSTPRRPTTQTGSSRCPATSPTYAGSGLRFGPSLPRSGHLCGVGPTGVPLNRGGQRPQHAVMRCVPASSCHHSYSHRCDAGYCWCCGRYRVGVLFAGADGAGAGDAVRPVWPAAADAAVRDSAVCGQPRRAARHALPPRHPVVSAPHTPLFRLFFC